MTEARTKSRASWGSTAPMPTMEAPAWLISSSFVESALKYSTSSSDHAPRKKTTSTGPRAVRIESRSCPPCALGKLNSGASSPTSGTCMVLVRATGILLKRSEEHTSELQSRQYLVCRLLLEKKKQ